jgi:hypothetical protein
MGRVCSTHEDKMGAYRIVVGIPEGKRPLGTPRRTWEDNIKMSWINMAQDRDNWQAVYGITTLMHSRVKTKHHQWTGFSTTYNCVLPSETASLRSVIMLSSNPLSYPAVKRLPRGFLAEILHALFVCIAIPLDFVIEYFVYMAQNEQLVLYR